MYIHIAHVHIYSGVNIPLATINSASLPSIPSPLPSQVIVTFTVTLLSEDTLTVAVELKVILFPSALVTIEFN